MHTSEGRNPHLTEFPEILYVVKMAMSWISLNELKIDENYCAGLAASKKNIIVNLKKIDFEIPPPI